MKKMLLALVLLPVTAIVHAQDKTTEIPMKPKHRFLKGAISQSGNAYIVTGNDKSSKTDLNVIGYDAALTETFAKTMVSKFEKRFGGGMSTPQKMYSMWLTPNGRFARMYDDDLLIDRSGNIIQAKYLMTSSLPDFETNFTLASDDYHLFFGYKKPEKRKKETDEGTYFYQVRHEDQNKMLLPIEFPAFETAIKDAQGMKGEKDGSESWGKSFFNDKQFYMVNKKLSKDRTENQYNIVGFDYQGKQTIALALVLKLGKGKNFSLANTGFGSYTIATSEMAGAGIMDEEATGNILVQGDNAFIYVYGLYSTDKLGNPNKADYNGFFLFKFDRSGKLIWQTEQAISNSNFNKTQRPLAVNVDLMLLPEDQIGFRIYNVFEKYAHFFTLNSADGKVLRSQAPPLKIEGNRWEGISGGSFPTGFAMDKIYPDKHMDINTLYATFLNEKVGTFLKNSKEDLNYNAEITPVGIYLIEENPKSKTFRLLRFDW